MSNGNGASKLVPRIVPWLDAEEWRSVRRALYSNKVDEIKLGILKAKIWLGRGKVPTAVESTVNFLEIILSDCEYLKEFLTSRTSFEEETEKDEINSDSESDRSLTAASDNDNENDYDELDSIVSQNSDEKLRLLRLAYNTAVIRFVNELVDRAQKSLFATSITKLADQIGLPRVFVDIRHEGTHDRLSSLELLRWASAEALKWLEDQYWSFEDDITPTTWLNEFNANVHGLLDQFCEQLEKINDTQPATALEKNCQIRIVSQIDFLQTLPRIMKTFLMALGDFKRKSKNVENVSESIVRILARNNGEIFYSVIVGVIFDMKDCENWTNWIIDELKKANNYQLILKFTTNLFTEFAKRSGPVLFKEKLEKIWESLKPLLKDSIEGEEKVDKFEKVFGAFLHVYGNQTTTTNKIAKQHQQVSKKVFSESLEFVNKRRFKEDLNLDGWGIVNENWRPCPLGSIPN